MEPRLKIGYDAKRVFQNFTGLGNYSRTLLASLSEHQPALELHLFAPKPNEHPQCAPFLSTPYQTHFPQSAFKSYWRTKGMVNDLVKNKIQIYHGLSHELPLGIERTGIKTVVSIHDLIFKKYPKQFKPIDRWIYEKKFRSACLRADVVVAISESTKQDIIDLYDIPEKKIQVIYQSIHPQFLAAANPTAHAATRASLSIPKDYFLYVGSIIPRKNLRLIVEAYALIANQNFPPLMIVGKGGAYRQSIESFIKANNLHNQIRFLDSISFADLPALYSGAIGMCYPSIYEGFGLPLVEALSQQTPCITYNGSSLPEAAGPGAIYLEQLSAQTIAAALRRLLEMPTEASRLARAGQQHIQQFQSKDICKTWQALYHQLLH